MWGCECERVRGCVCVRVHVRARKCIVGVYVQVWSECMCTYCVYARVCVHVYMCAYVKEEFVIRAEWRRREEFELLCESAFHTPRVVPLDESKALEDHRRRDQNAHRQKVGWQRYGCGRLGQSRLWLWTVRVAAAREATAQHHLPDSAVHVRIAHPCDQCTPGFTVKTDTPPHHARLPRVPFHTGAGHATIASSGSSENTLDCY